jgi:CRISPR type III-A-associated protein Csm2
MSEQVSAGGIQPGGEEGGGVRPAGREGGGAGARGPGPGRDRIGRGGDRGGRGPDRGGRDRGRDRSSEVYFDPGRSVSELVDELAQRQARGIRRISGAELAKFYTEIKDMHRLLVNGGPESWKQVEPRLRLLRSKAYYANRRIGQGHGVPREFRDFVDRGVQSVRSEEDFVKFARHFEAVVGFLYGMGSVQS